MDIQSSGGIQGGVPDINLDDGLDFKDIDMLLTYGVSGDKSEQVEQILHRNDAELKKLGIDPDAPLSAKLERLSTYGDAFGGGDVSDALARLTGDGDEALANKITGNFTKEVGDKLLDGMNTIQPSGIEEVEEMPEATDKIV